MAQRPFRDKNLWQCLLLSFLIALGSMLFYLWRDGGVLVIDGDEMGQGIPIAAAMNRMIKSGAIGWSWNIGLGTQSIGGFAVYNLASPFFLLTLPFPPALYPYLTAPLYILKYMTAAAMAYLFLSMLVKERSYAVCGALLYAFSSFQNEHLMYQFKDTVALFPLLLIGIERILKGKRPTVFTLGVFLNCMTSYYMFVGEAVFCVIYFCCRMADAECRKTAKKSFLSCLAGGTIGVGMSAAIFIPSILFIMGNSRSSAGIADLFYYGDDLLKILRSILLPAELMTDRATIIRQGWGGFACYLPMVGISLVLAYLMKKRDWLTLTILVLALFSLCPFLESSFSMFTLVYKRWLYMYTLILSLASVRVMEERESYPVRAGVFLSISLLVLFCVIVIARNLIFRHEVFAVQIVISYAGLLAVLVLTDPRIRTKHYALLCMLSIAVFALVSTFHMEYLYHRNGEARKTYAAKFAHGAALEPVEDAYRYATGDNILIYPGRGIGTGTFCSTTSPTIFSFEQLFGHTNPVWSMDLTQIPGLTALLGGKYRINESAPDGALSISEQPACPIGFSYTSCITEEELTALPEECRGAAALDRMILRTEDLPQVQGVLSHDPLPSYEDPETEIPALIERDIAASASGFTRDHRGFSCKTDFPEARALYFTVPFDPGWRAMIDNKPADILYSGGMMSVLVPAGVHSIVFSYHTPGLTAGLILTALSWAAFLLFLLFPRMRSEKRD